MSADPSIIAKPRPEDKTPATLESERAGDGGLRLRVAGTLDADGAAALWRRLPGLLGSGKGASSKGVVAIDAGGVTYLDGSGAALLGEMHRLAGAAGRTARIRNLPERFENLLRLYVPEIFEEKAAGGAKREKAGGAGGAALQPSLIEELGRETHETLSDFRVQVSFIGELFAAMFGALARPRSVRWREVVAHAEAAGANALPIVVLMGFLIGLIMAFQAAIPMQRFGAELYVADLISLSMFRELGPLIACVLLAGRTGSAYAAELGTMKVNEELDALATMGLDPVRFLVVVRVLASTLTAPLLTIFCTLAGLIGGLVVCLSLNITALTYYKEAMSLVDYSDFFTGFGKSFVFGFQVGGIGCLRGLQAGTGASAVGRAATRAVVSAVIVLIVTDGLFSVLFFLVDW